MSKITQSQINYHSERITEKFGIELEKLKAKVEWDIKNRGNISQKTIQDRDKLIKKIMEEKQEHDIQNGYK